MGNILTLPFSVSATQACSCSAQAVINSTYKVHMTAFLCKTSTPPDTACSPYLASSLCRSLQITVQQWLALESGRLTCHSSIVSARIRQRLCSGRTEIMNVIVVHAERLSTQPSSRIEGNYILSLSIMRIDLMILHLKNRLNCQPPRGIPDKAFLPVPTIEATLGLSRRHHRAKSMQIRRLKE